VGTFTYAAAASGGTGNFDYLWSFSGLGQIVATDVTSPIGSATVDTGNQTYVGDVTITDRRPDQLHCTVKGSAPTKVFMPIKVHLARAAAGPTCPAMASDSAHYIAMPSGGSGNYNLAWQGAICNGGSCTIDPPDDAFCYSQSFGVIASDTDAVALAAGCVENASEIETYSKLTFIETTDN
jgi:hypothetical protein